MKICTVCHAESADDARFCSSCGTRFAQPCGAHICPDCRAEVPESVDFCPNCGHPFISHPIKSDQPLDVRPVVEIGRPAGEWEDRLLLIIRWLRKSWQMHPLRLLAVVAVILLLPLCCVINSVFAVRNLFVMAEEPAPRRIPTLTPAAAAADASSTTTGGSPTVAPTLTTAPPTASPTSTETPAQPFAETEFAGCPPAGAIPQAGKVENVIDGDTIDVLLGDKSVRVRYIGIDAAEMDESDETQRRFALEALQKNAALVEGKDVYLVPDVSGVDAGGRLLRYVFCGDVFVNYELLRQGYARVLPSPPDAACDGYFAQAQQDALQAGIGRWRASPTPEAATQPAVNEATATQAPLQPTAAGDGAALCNCSGPDLNCKDFPSGSAAQACFDYCYPQYGDIFNLDRDMDGLACENW